MNSIENLLPPLEIHRLFRRRQFRPHEILINLPQFRMQSIVIGDEACDLGPLELQRGVVTMLAAYDPMIVIRVLSEREARP